jgi:hypothetical protein
LGGGHGALLTAARLGHGGHRGALPSGEQGERNGEEKEEEVERNRVQLPCIDARQGHAAVVLAWLRARGSSAWRPRSGHAAAIAAFRRPRGRQ